MFIHSSKLTQGYFAELLHYQTCSCTICRERHPKKLKVEQKLETFAILPNHNL